MAKKSVHFDPVDSIQIFEPEPQPHSDFMREAHERKALEKIVCHRPRSQMEHVLQLISSWRKNTISIVFGNLGRQPFLLYYYLDLCFHFDESIKIVSQWPLPPSEYQQTQGQVDFLIRVEPPFGFAVQKHPTAKHVVILTSHLSFSYWGKCDMAYYYLHLSNVRTSRLPDPNLRNGEVFEPPLFHTQIPSLPETVLVDVSKSNTAHEAFLRLLTGRDMIRNRPYSIDMKERDKEIITVNLKYTCQRFKALGPFKKWVDEGSLLKDLFLCRYLNTY